MASSSLKMTYDVLPDNTVLAMHIKEQEPIIKLTPTERFYTDVSRVYEHLLSNENDGDSDSDSDNEAMDRDTENKEKDEDEAQSESNEETVFGTILADLDRARFQLDEMSKLCDMLTGSGPKRELTYKLSAPMTYPVMTNRHFAAICCQKRDQLNGITDILHNGIKRIRSTSKRGRTFSENLVSLSKHWRLASMDVLRNDESMEFMGDSDARNQLFIDFRLIRRRNNLDGLLPLYRSAKSGNIQIRLDHESPLIEYLSSLDDTQIENESDRKTDDKMESAAAIGFDDGDISDSSEEDEDEEKNANKSDDEEESEMMIPHSTLSSVVRIDHFLYHQQIYLLYSEVFRVLKNAVQHWDPSQFNGITIKIRSDTFQVHTPSFDHDFFIRFTSPSFNMESDHSMMSNRQWNSMSICGPDVDSNLSQFIESEVIRMVTNQWSNRSNAESDGNTLQSLRKIEAKHHLQHSNGGRLWNMNSRIGRFERNTKEEQVVSGEERKEEVDKGGNCEILEYVVNHVNWDRLQKRLKSVLKQISSTAAFNIQWSQSNSKSLVNVTIEKRGKLLLSITLNGMKLSVLKYERPDSKKTNYLRQTQCSKLMPCHSVDALEKLIRSFA